MEPYKVVVPHLVNKLKKEVKEVYHMIETKDSILEQLNEMRANFAHNAAITKELRSQNSELRNTNDLLKTTIEESSNNLEFSEKDINEMINLKTKKLQSEITANTAAIKGMKGQNANVTPKIDSSSREKVEGALKSQVDNDPLESQQDDDDWVLEQDELQQDNDFFDMIF